MDERCGCMQDRGSNDRCIVNISSVDGELSRQLTCSRDTFIRCRLLKPSTIRHRALVELSLRLTQLCAADWRTRGGVGLEMTSQQQQHDAVNPQLWRQWWWWWTHHPTYVVNCITCRLALTTADWTEANYWRDVRMLTCAPCISTRFWVFEK